MANIWPAYEAIYVCWFDCRLLKIPNLLFEIFNGLWGGQDFGETDMLRLVFILCCLAWLPLTAAGQTFDLSTQPIGLIAPGTVVQHGPPQGWTHLIVKSHPRAASGDLDKIPERDVRLASPAINGIGCQGRAKRWWHVCDRRGCDRSGYFD